MKGKWPIAAGIALFLIITALSAGCGSDKNPIDTSGESDVIVKAVAISPDTSDIIADSVWETLEATSIRVGEEKSYTNDIGLGVVRVKAIADTAYLYLWFDWRDSSKSDRPGYWLYIDTCGLYGGWGPILRASGSECTPIDNAVNPWHQNEDFLALLLDMNNNGTEKGNCATTCHDANDTTDTGFRHHTTGGGTIDGWVWRAGTTNKLGLADDQLWGERTVLSHNDSYGTLSYWLNANPDEENTHPQWMHSSGHGYRGDTLLSSDTIHFDPQQSVGWVTSDGIPGYVHNPNWNSGNTSRYDVKASSQYDASSKRWTVVLWRRLTTPYTAEDVDFKDGRNEYQATLAITNHAFLRHSGSKPFTIKFQ
jgi:hypothetical protein